MKLWASNTAAATPKETSTNGKIIVSLTVTGSPTTVLADKKPSIPLNKDATVVSNLFSAILYPPGYLN